MKLQRLAWLALSGLALSASVLAEGSADEGKAKSQMCVACHGIDGNSPNPEWPSIAGQSASYVLKQLKAYKANERQNPLMSPMVAGLNDDDMEDLAVFYSTQTRTGLEADAQKIAEGQRLYRGGDPAAGIAACTACHGPNGHGIAPAGYPALQGQHATYIAAQLRNYRSGTRTTDQSHNRMMREIASRLTEAQIDSVAQYVQGLR